MAEVDNSIAKAKLAKFVNENPGQHKRFYHPFTDEDILDLLKSFKTMNIDLIRDLIPAAKERKIQSNQWQEDSPLTRLWKKV